MNLCGSVQSVSTEGFGAPGSMRLARWIRTCLRRRRVARRSVRSGWRRTAGTRPARSPPYPKPLPLTQRISVRRDEVAGSGFYRVCRAVQDSSGRRRAAVRCRRARRGRGRCGRLVADHHLLGVAIRHRLCIARPPERQWTPSTRRLAPFDDTLSPLSPDCSSFAARLWSALELGSAPRRRDSARADSCFRGPRSGRSIVFAPDWRTLLLRTGRRLRRTQIEIGRDGQRCARLDGELVGRRFSMPTAFFKSSQADSSIPAKTTTTTGKQLDERQ